MPEISMLVSACVFSVRLNERPRQCGKGCKKEHFRKLHFSDSTHHDSSSAAGRSAFAQKLSGESCSMWSMSPRLTQTTSSSASTAPKSRSTIASELTCTLYWKADSPPMSRVLERTSMMLMTSRLMTDERSTRMPGRLGLGQG